MNKESTAGRYITESRDRWKPIWRADRNGFGRCKVNYSSRSRVLTLQRLDIEERSSVLQIRESIIGGVFRFGERHFCNIGNEVSYIVKSFGECALARGNHVS